MNRQNVMYHVEYAVDIKRGIQEKRSLEDQGPHVTVGI